MPSMIVWITAPGPFESSRTSFPLRFFVRSLTCDKVNWYLTPFFPLPRLRATLRMLQVSHHVYRGVGILFWACDNRRL
jgi:hypothetical protein